MSRSLDSKLKNLQLMETLANAEFLNPLAPVQAPCQVHAAVQFPVQALVQAQALVPVLRPVLAPVPVLRPAPAVVLYFILQAQV